MTIRSKVNELVRPRIRALSVYHVPEPGKCIKLDAMENPYGWPEPMVKDWLIRLRGVSLNRYPDPQAAALKRRLRAIMGISEDSGLLLGNGSDELIQMILLSVAEPGRTILAPEPTFVMYRMLAEVIGLDYVGVPLRGDDFGLDLPAMLRAIKVHRPAVVFLAYPNNPTGNLFARDDVRKTLDAADGLVVVDEAYAAFTDETFLHASAGNGNALVLRTMSKMGFAGLRLGMLMGPRDLLEQIDKTRLPYNINVLTQVTVEFALERRQLIEEQTRRIRKDRKDLLAELRQIDGIRPYPSEANFILFRVPTGKATSLFESMRQQGVLIKNLDTAGGLLQDCLRVTVGTPDENSAFLSALQKGLSDK